MICSFFCL